MKSLNIFSKKEILLLFCGLGYIPKFKVVKALINLSKLLGDCIALYRICILSTYCNCRHESLGSPIFQLKT